MLLGYFLKIVGSLDVWCAIVILAIVIKLLDTLASSFLILFHCEIDDL